MRILFILLFIILSEYVTLVDNWYQSSVLIHELLVGNGKNLLQVQFIKHWDRDAPL